MSERTFVVSSSNKKKTKPTIPTITLTKDKSEIGIDDNGDDAKESGPVRTCLTFFTFGEWNFHCTEQSQRSKQRAVGCTFAMDSKEQKHGKRVARVTSAKMTHDMGYNNDIEL